MTWRDYFLIGLGSAAGGIMRVFLSRFFDRITSGYPWGTFYVNFIGCFLIGWLWGGYGIKLHSLRHDMSWNFLASGFLGGFTTFSTYILQAAQLWNEGSSGTALLYVLTTLLACIVGVGLGVGLGIWGRMSL
jgi:CrcB protein